MKKWIDYDEWVFFTTGKTKMENDKPGINQTTFHLEFNVDWFNVEKEPTSLNLHKEAEKEFGNNPEMLEKIKHYLNELGYKE